MNSWIVIRQSTLTLVVLLHCSLLTTAAESPPIETQHEVYRTTLVRELIWGVEVTIPHYEERTDSIIAGQSYFVLAAYSHGRCELMLSMTVRHVAEGTSADACRRQTIWNPKDLAKHMSEFRVLESQEFPLTYMIYDQLDQNPDRIPGRAEITQHAMGHWVRNDDCFVLSVRSAQCPTFVYDVLPILRSIALLEDTGTTIESLTLAKQQARDPTDFTFQLSLAERSIYDDEPHDLAHARDLFHSVLNIAGEDIDLETRYRVARGLGYAWLLDGDGGQATLHLEEAVGLERELDQEPLSIKETQYLLLSAYSLSKDLDHACPLASHLLTDLPAGDRPYFVKFVKKDRRMKRLRKSSCYKKLLEEHELK